MDNVIGWIIIFLIFNSGPFSLARAIVAHNESYLGVSVSLFITGLMIALIVPSYFSVSKVWTYFLIDVGVGLLVSGIAIFALVFDENNFVYPTAIWTLGNAVLLEFLMFFVDVNVFPEPHIYHKIYITASKFLFIILITIATICFVYEIVKSKLETPHRDIKRITSLFCAFVGFIEIGLEIIKFLRKIFL
ncbi:hypothetical protein QUF90_04125 [Desulfococcaceae bacterium HSG9]|nr:hypothetical protein [Desulfococcaceae bacterium HSG9]